MRLIAILALAFALSACAEFTTGALDLLDKAREAKGKVEITTAKAAARSMSAYCQGVSLDGRKELRDLVNGQEEANGAEILITCPGDAEAK